MAAKSISLFAGAGGMDLGVDGAGFKTICAIEIDPHCAATLRRNGRGKAVWQTDVRVVDPLRLMPVLGLKPGQLALLHAGPPCQPFSQIGKQGGLEDPRGSLVFEVVRFARALRPTAVLIEQVPKFLTVRTSRGKPLLEVLRKEFANLGFDTHADVLQASEHGVAQHRRISPARRHATSASNRSRGCPRRTSSSLSANRRHK